MGISTYYIETGIYSIPAEVRIALQMGDIRRGPRGVSLDANMSINIKNCISYSMEQDIFSVSSQLDCMLKADS
jgi:hypothetical protein